MERRGILRDLLQEPGSGDVRGGARSAAKTPWLWWAGAVLWVVCWPAVIAVKLSTSWPAWLAWWLPLLLCLTHMVLLACPIWLSERSASQGNLRRRFGKVTTVTQLLALEPAEFEVWSAMLFQLIGYRVARHPQEGADHGIDLIVSSDRVQLGLVQCKRYRGTVGEPTVRDLYGTMTHMNADYGWLVTTGAISRQARTWCEGKPIELWDGQMLVTQARRYR
jgi:hypothetical protein